MKSTSWKVLLAVVLLIASIVNAGASATNGGSGSGSGNCSDSYDNVTVTDCVTTTTTTDDATPSTDAATAATTATDDDVTTAVTTVSTQGGTSINDSDNSTIDLSTDGTTVVPGVLSDEHILGIAAGALLIIIILLFILVFICICCCCRSKSGDGKSKKSKKPKEGSAHWSEEGKVQLLNIAEKAGIEDTSKNGPEAGPSDQPDEDTAAPVPPTAAPVPPAAASAQDQSEPDTSKKGDDKRVVTVATFGFPEVAIQPSSKPDGEADDREAEPEVKKAEAKASKGENEEGTGGNKPKFRQSESTQPCAALESSSNSGMQDPTVVSIGGVPLPPPPPPPPPPLLSSATKAASTPDATVQQQQGPSLPTYGENLDYPFDLGIESSILSTEAIEKALGISSS